MAAAGLADILLKATGADTENRKRAEEMLNKAESDRAAAFYVALAQEAQKETNSSEVRQLAAVRLKNAIDDRDDAKKMAKAERWRTVDAPARSQVKTLVTSMLGTKDDKVRHVLALLISKIGGAEITPTTNTWPELVPGLARTVQTAAAPEEARTCSLYSLSLLMEELDQYDECPLEQDKVDSVLTSVVGAMAPEMSPAIREFATRALNSTLPFVAKNFQIEAARDRLMNAVCTAAKSEDVKLKKQALKCIATCAKLYYHFLPRYMGALVPITASAAGHADEAVASTALEFWYEIADAEMVLAPGQSKRFIHTVAKDLLKMLLNLMTKQDPDGDDGTESIADTAAAVLQLTLGVLKNDALQYVVPFFQANVTSDNWRLRDAAVLSYAVLQSAVDDAAILEQDKVVLPRLMQRLVPGEQREADEIARSSTAYCVAEIFSHHIGAVDVARFADIVRMLAQSLSDKPRVAKQAVVAFDNLIDSLDEKDALRKPDGSTLLSPMLHNIISALLVRADAPDSEEYELRVECYNLIVAIVERTGPPDSEVLRRLYQEVMRRMGVVLDEFAAADSAKRVRLAALSINLCHTMMEIASVMEDKVGDLADASMALLLRAHDSKASPPEAFLAMGVLAHKVTGKHFMKYMKDVAPRLAAGISERSDASLCLHSLLLATDVLMSLQEGARPLIPNLIRLVLDVLRDNNVDNSCKPPALSILGDICRVLDIGCLPEIPKFAGILFNVAELPGVGDEGGPDEDDEEGVEQAEALRQAVLDAWTAIIFAFSSDDEASAADKAKRAEACKVALTQAIPQPGGPPIPPMAACIARSLERWSKPWRAAYAKDQELPGNTELLAGCVSLLSQLARALPREMVAAFVTKDMEWVPALIALQRAQEVEDETPEADSIAAQAALALGLRKKKGK